MSMLRTTPTALRPTPSNAPPSSPNAPLFRMNTSGASGLTASQDGLAGGVEASRQMARTDLPLLKPHARDFARAGQKYELPPALLAAIASRESRGGAGLDARGWGTGDTNGYGLMQVDHNHHTPVGAPMSYEHIDQAASILKGTLEQVKRDHPQWTPEQQLRGAVAGYNMGADNVRTLAGMDGGSTGEDYSADVWARAQELAPHFGGTAAGPARRPVDFPPFNGPYVPAPSLADVRERQAELRIGQRGEAVGQLQDQLVAQGFLEREEVGQDRGFFGPRTRHAVWDFQQARGLTPPPGKEGTVGATTLQWLARGGGAPTAQPPVSRPGQADDFTPSGAAPTRWIKAPSLDQVRGNLTVLRQGMQGPAVAELQRKLGVAADGQFGLATRKAVADFQKARGLEVPPQLEGVVGQTTLKELEKAGAPTSSGGSLRMPLLRQGDYNDVVADRGCGITSVAMAVNGLLGKNLSPDDIHASHGFSLIPALRDHGVKVTDHGDLHNQLASEEQAFQAFSRAIAQGNPVMFAANGNDVNGTHWSSGRGHIMLATGTSVQNGERMLSFNDPATGTSRTVPFRDLWQAGDHPDGNFVLELSR
ncbi:MAG TPA: peptidoglycan-binding protein [Archangium sp.]|uniref:peptidoglycan-binding protein n=1 Tax=Archangium sp. TaxID=1872627 RepID=UPI002E368A18|nr:peptidoglycan-binding protein [Archangium sp.]HEX5751966.1 peptidoglycan-binding protein [Archangium sp.]